MANIPGAVTDPSRVRGENIELKSGGDTIKGYLARPSQSGRYPGIVVIHEAFGLVEHIRDIARRFANIGYNAIAPDLYSRKGGPSDPNDINTVFPVMFGKSDAEAVQDLEAAADHLRRASRRDRQDRRHRLLLGRPADPALRVQQRQTRCGCRLLGRVHPSRDAGCRDNPGAPDADPQHGRPPALPALRGLRRGGPEPVPSRNPRSCAAVRSAPART